MLDDARTLPAPARASLATSTQLFRIRRLMWSSYALAVPGLPPALAGLRILHLTDLHVTHVWMPAYDTMLARIAADPPDLILITGDFVETKKNPRPAVPNVLRLVNALRSRLGIYGILGNHDGDLLPALVGDWPVRLLHNESVTLRDGDTAIEVVGLYGVEPADTSRRVLTDIGSKPVGTLRLVMAHYPHQAMLFEPGAVDAVFAGHTHGGQVCLPGGWPLVTHDLLPKRFARGVHWLGDRWLSVARGIGFSTYPVRTFCPPEIIEVMLQPN